MKVLLARRDGVEGGALAILSEIAIFQQLSLFDIIPLQHYGTVLQA
jgi:hypothetical protein